MNLSRAVEQRRHCGIENITCIKKAILSMFWWNFFKYMYQEEYMLWLFWVDWQVKLWRWGNLGNSGQWVIPDRILWWVYHSDNLKNHASIGVIKRNRNKSSERSFFQLNLSKHYEMIDNRVNCPELPAVQNYPDFPYKAYPPACSTGDLSTKTFAL